MKGTVRMKYLLLDLAGELGVGGVRGALAVLVGRHTVVVFEEWCLLKLRMLF